MAVDKNGKELPKGITCAKMADIWADLYIKGKAIACMGRVQKKQNG